MSRILVLGLLLIVSSPAALAATEVSEERQAEVDGLDVSAEFHGSVADGADMRSELFRLESELYGAFAPSDSNLAELFAAFFALVPPTPELQQAGLVDAQEEADALYEESTSVRTSQSASNEEVEVTAQAEAGTQSHEAGASAAADDVVPVEVEEASSDSGPAPVAEEAPGEDPQAQPIRDEPRPSLLQSVAALPETELATPAAIAASVAILGASTTTAFALAPGWRTALARLAKRLGLFALFSRIAQEDILNHERRSELLEFIRNNPGERVEVARKTLGFSNGSMHYHLRVLQDRDLVRVLKDGSLARLYPAGPKIRPAPYVPPERRRFIESLATSPGLTQRELANSLGLSERMVSYHVKALNQQGLLEVRADGPRKRLFPAPATPVLVLAPAA